MDRSPRVAIRVAGDMMGLYALTTQPHDLYARVTVGPGLFLDVELLRGKLHLFLLLETLESYLMQQRAEDGHIKYSHSSQADTYLKVKNAFINQNILHCIKSYMSWLLRQFIYIGSRVCHSKAIRYYQNRLYSNNTTNSNNKETTLYIKCKKIYKVFYTNKTYP